MRSALRNAWLRAEPDGKPDRQLLVGDAFEVDETRAGWVRGRAEKDGYPGWVREDALGPEIAPTHWVAVRTTWAFGAPDIKSDPVVDLHMTSPVEALEETDTWLRIRHGDGAAFVPLAHCRAILAHLRSPVEAARAFLDTPYVWAGNTGFGLDCSGLVQVALRASGFECPGDSHEQERMPFARVPDGAALEAGDLVFWKGHVAMATGPDRIIHANAHHMKVVEETASPAFARIADTETGPITSRLRPERKTGH